MFYRASDIDLKCSWKWQLHNEVKRATKEIPMYPSGIYDNQTVTH